jgi:hypothetical protein
LNLTAASSIARHAPRKGLFEANLGHQTATSSLPVRPSSDSSSLLDLPLPGAGFDTSKHCNGSAATLGEKINFRIWSLIEADGDQKRTVAIRARPKCQGQQTAANSMGRISMRRALILSTVAIFVAAGLGYGIGWVRGLYLAFPINDSGAAAAWVQAVGSIATIAAGFAGIILADRFQKRAAQKQEEASYATLRKSCLGVTDRRNDAGDDRRNGASLK